MKVDIDAKMLPMLGGTLYNLTALAAQYRVSQKGVEKTTQEFHSFLIFSPSMFGKRTNWRRYISHLTWRFEGSWKPYGGRFYSISMYSS